MRAGLPTPLGTTFNPVQNNAARAPPIRSTQGRDRRAGLRQDREEGGAARIRAGAPFPWPVAAASFVFLAAVAVALSGGRTGLTPTPGGAR